jgi:hypothetical protein
MEFEGRKRPKKGIFRSSGRWDIWGFFEISKIKWTEQLTRISLK